MSSPAKNPFKGKFCNSPFEYAYIDHAGNVFVCCPGGLPRTIGNLLHNDWPEVWNSPSAQLLRESILDQSFVHCYADNCPYLELDGRLVPRERAEAGPYADTIASGSTLVTRPPHEVNIAYDATCNLSCPYCREDVYGARGADLNRARYLHDKIWDQVLPGVRVVTMAGNGDAFASRLYREALENFDRSRYPDMNIQVVTNGLLLTPQAWAKAAPAHDAIWWVNVSINAATAETFAINQRGGRFDVLLKNLEFIGDVRRSGSLRLLTFSFIVQANNHHEMPAFVELGKRFGADRVNFTHLLPGPYSRSEFEALAIHRPTHPRHHELLEIMRHPAIADPIVYAANLQPYLPGRQAQGHAWPSLDVREAGASFSQDVAWNEVRKTLELDEATAATIVAEVNGLHDAFADILATRGLQDLPSPLERLADAVKSGKPYDADEVLMRAARELVYRAPGITYLQAFSTLSDASFMRIHGNLDRRQRIALRGIGIDSPVRIDTGHRPIERHLKALLAPPEAVDIRTWQQMCHVLQLNEVQTAAFQRVLRAFRDRALEIVSAVAESDAQAPIEYLASHCTRPAGTWESGYLAYLGEQRPAGQPKSYLTQLGELEMEARQELARLLEPQQQITLSSARISSLNDIEIGHDPLGQALQRLIARRALAAR